MNRHLQAITDLIQQAESLSAEQQAAISKSLKDADKELEITAFKLDRTEKVKRTTAILLEETIEELEQKRKAVEAQNRELEIGAALERVRTVAMSMGKPDDMLHVCSIISEQLELLNVKAIRNVQTAIFHPEKGTYTNYEYYARHGKTFVTEATYGNNEKLAAFAEAMQKGAGQFFEASFVSDELKDWIAYQKNSSVFVDEYLYEAPSLNYHWNSLGPVALGLSTYEPLSEGGKELFRRFAKVFELAYRRYLDIEKAEAQAREAQIEAALERVRSRTMAMHRTSELQGVIHIVHNELLNLKLSVNGGSFVVMNENVGPELRCWGSGGTANTSEEVRVPHFGMPFCTNLVEGIKKGPGFFTEDFSQNEKREYFTKLFEHKPWSDVSSEQKKETLSSSGGYTRSVVVSKHTALFVINHTGRKFTEAENDVLKRFANVFEQTYTRFLDLQKAEAQAREAQIEAALERVRSRTLAMQKSDELTETATVLFQQLILLGIAPVRLYIGMVKDDEGKTEFWITDENGGKVRSAFEVNLSKNPSFNKMLKGFQEGKKSLVIDMHGKELQQYLNYLAGINVPFNRGLAQKRRIQYVAYFSKGFIGMASPDEQPPETMELLERFAYTFNLTFTRFNDLQLAEAHAVQAGQDLMEIKAARQRAEEALSELQVTQKQLVQSEKMASLGELTAGIAHEIQNPLNFVNNFSEVSNELLDEMLEEAVKGNYDEVKAIANDVKQNLEKIAHHGKRADGIVKGMLQHSRTSSGQKEPTDINALADEYLRLAYHGLRAKNKSFNATLQTDYDESVGSINVIPQDVGRVILNLITNAFYAVGEKKEEVQKGYAPTVSISTKKLGDKAEVRVQDNGKGIPQDLVEKIFQPFFTTKPTGQGTGLGLSLAYDIVKAHGGELKVQTEQGAGSIFIVQLPI